VITKDPVLIAKVAGEVADAPVIVTEDVPNVKIGLLYCPIRIVLSENTSITGIPEMVLTEKRLPDNPSTTENNCPEGPLTSKIVASRPVPCIDNTFEEPDATVGPNIVVRVAVPVKEPVIEPDTIATEPDVLKGANPYLPMLIVSSENTSINGKPEIVFTENKEPDNPSVTVNNCPDVPNMFNKVPPAVEPCTVVTSLDPEVY
jgi:hypothetical protein